MPTAQNRREEDSLRFVDLRFALTSAMSEIAERPKQTLSSTLPDETNSDFKETLVC